MNLFKGLNRSFSYDISSGECCKKCGSRNPPCDNTKSKHLSSKTDIIFCTGMLNKIRW